MYIDLQPIFDFLISLIPYAIAGTVGGIILGGIAIAGLKFRDKIVSLFH
jgi:hypothetical protein